MKPMTGTRERMSDEIVQTGCAAKRGLTGLLCGLASRAARWAACRRGVSAVEFALLAPVLGFSLIATVDLGFGLSERMAMDHALRSGAQRAMADPGASEALATMRATATMNFTLDDQLPAAGVEPLSLSAIRYCACPENVGFAVTCSTICTGSKPTFIFYRMTAQKTYRPRLLPVMTFTRSAQVQIR